MAKRKRSGSETVRYATGECALGWILVARSEAGVCAILLGDSREDIEREVRDRFHGATPDESAADLRRLVAAAAETVETPSRRFGAELDLRGTQFQRRVWRALRAIPAGSTTTYAALAAKIGAPRSAARAVGSACGANPIAVAVPCHRVLRADGSLSGYRWGLARKRELLDRESAA